MLGYCQEEGRELLVASFVLVARCSLLVARCSLRAFGALPCYSDAVAVEGAESFFLAPGEGFGLGEGAVGHALMEGLAEVTQAGEIGGQGLGDLEVFGRSGGD